MKKKAPSAAQQRGLSFYWGLLPPSLARPLLARFGLCRREGEHSASRAGDVAYRRDARTARLLFRREMEQVSCVQ